MFPKRKYGNQPTGGYSSGLERGMALYLRALEQSGEITDIREQVSVYLTDARIQYIADFRATDTKMGEEIYYESKGFETAIWRIKRRLWLYYGPGKLRVYKGTGTRLSLHEELVPKGKGETK